MARVAVIGATSWGTTLAALFARNGNDVSLLTRSVAEADTLESAREHRRHRPGLPFPGTMHATFDPEPLATADVVVLAVPSATMRENLIRSAPAISPDATVLSAAKGIEAPE